MLTLKQQILLNNKYLSQNGLSQNGKRMCAKEFALPVTMLITRILACMEWPEMWREHWVIPIFKKNANFLKTTMNKIPITKINLVNQ